MVRTETADYYIYIYILNNSKNQKKVLRFPSFIITLNLKAMTNRCFSERL